MNDEVQVRSTASPSGRRTVAAFDYGKLVNDIASCFGHSPNQAKHATWLAQTVEDQVLKNNKLVIDASELAAVTHQALSGFDKLAAEQFLVRHKSAMQEK